MDPRPRRPHPHRLAGIAHSPPWKREALEREARPIQCAARTAQGRSVLPSLRDGAPSSPRAVPRATRAALIAGCTRAAHNCQCPARPGLGPGRRLRWSCLGSRGPSGSAPPGSACDRPPGGAGSSRVPPRPPARCRSTTPPPQRRRRGRSVACRR